MEYHLSQDHEIIRLETKENPNICRLKFLFSRNTQSLNDCLTVHWNYTCHGHLINSTVGLLSLHANLFRISFSVLFVFLNIHDVISHLCLSRNVSHREL